MNFIEELKNLDVNDIGRWPLPMQGFFMALCFLLATGAGFWFFVWENQMPRLETSQNLEQELRATFEVKQKKAANFSAYKAQLADIERSFGTMLRQLPGKTEIPNLLVDISQTGLGAGLQEELFRPLEEVRRDFYAEKLIKIRLTGSYHQFGQFVSDIAILPRIVTLHDLEIVPKGKDSGFDELVLNITAKTYRYLEEDEVQALADNEVGKEAKGKGRGKARTTRDTSKGVSSKTKQRVETK